MVDLQGFGMLLLRGSMTTLTLALFALFVAIALGLGAALLRVYGHSTLAHIVTVYTTVIRGIPDLALMLLIFYSLQGWVSELAIRMHWPGVVIDPFSAGVMTLGFIYGASFAETFRGALIAIPTGQIEAARAMGLRPKRILVRIIFPQMLTLALPGITNNWLVLLKSTALVSVIGLQDLVTFGGQAGRATQRPFFFMLMVGLIFLLITAVSKLGLDHFGHRINPAGRTTT